LVSVPVTPTSTVAPLPVSTETEQFQVTWSGNIEAIPVIAQASTQIPGGNTPPELVNPISDQIAIEGAAFSFTFSEDTFADADTDDSLTYSVTLEDGSAG